MNNKIPKAIQLFLTFIKIGAFTFGGGYAMLPLIQKEIVEKKHWITDNDILEIVAISESTFPDQLQLMRLLLLAFVSVVLGCTICNTWSCDTILPDYSYYIFCT